MKSLKSEQELGRYFRTWAEKQRRRRGVDPNENTVATPAAPSNAMESSALRPALESVTNTQDAAVDGGMRELRRVNYAPRG